MGMRYLGPRYKPGTDGWVIRHEHDIPTKSGVPLVTWWFGPDHSWGRTFGPLDYSVEVYPTRKWAEREMRTLGRDSRNSVQRVSEAEGEAS